MLVRDVMTQGVYTCTAEQWASDAAQLMWKHDIGVLPVVDGEGQPIGMITDRDICLAAHQFGRPLNEISVASAMTKGVFTCKQDDRVAEAEHTMRDWQVMRLPVVNVMGKVVGILSIDDIVRQRAASLLERGREWINGDILDTLEAIGRRRHDARLDRG